MTRPVPTFYKANIKMSIKDLKLHFTVAKLRVDLPNRKYLKGQHVLVRCMDTDPSKVHLTKVQEGGWILTYLTVFSRNEIFQLPWYNFEFEELVNKNFVLR